MMKAVTRSVYGHEQVLQIKELPKPVPSPDQILVRVVATTVNRTDCAILLGKPFIMRIIGGLFRPRKKIPGTDFAGIIEAKGSRVDGFTAGERVWGFDDSGLSSQAEYICIDQRNAILKIPDSINFQQAAACAEGAHYAFNFLKKVQLNSGDRVLVNGATGAIGSALLQMLVARGLKVTAVCRSEHAERVLTLGADNIIAYDSADFTATAEKYEAVFDAVGKSSFFKSKKILTKKGVYISSELGAGWQNLFLSLVTPLFRGREVQFPYPFQPERSLRYVVELIRLNRFDPLIDRVYNLDQVQQAYGYVIAGNKIGNVVLSVQDGD
jgi:NADPH:quinone reductase-like Zn-dependent oxidoreductase